MTEEEFRTLFEVHFEEIRRYIFFRSGDAVIATDIAQETFLKIWDKQMDIAPYKDLPLLYTISGNLMVSHFRREKLSRKAHNEMELDLKVNPDESIEYKELKERYKRALMKMPEKQRTVFMMSRMENLTYIEISTRLGIGTKAVEKRMNRALKFLRVELDLT